jgi:zinc protease
MIANGSRKYNADEIAIAFDNVGAIYTNAVNRDMAVLGLRSLTDPKFLNPALSIFSEVIATPAFPEREFNRVKKQILNLLNQQGELPGVIATKTFYKTLYGDNPYGHPILGNAETISNMTKNDLTKFYQQYYVGKNALLVIVGALCKQDAQRIAENLVSKLALGEAPGPIASPISSVNASTKKIAFPSEQTHILIGQLGIAKNDPAYYALTVGNYILGGGPLTSRLFDQVREKRGLAYSVRSQFVPLKDRGPFLVELQTRNNEVQNAIKVVDQTLQQFISTGPTENELKLAKKNLTQGFILKLASNSAVMANVINIAFYRMPLNYLDTYKDKINAVNMNDMNHLFRQLISPNKFITVTVGK